MSGMVEIGGNMYEEEMVAVGGEVRGDGGDVIRHEGGMVEVEKVAMREMGKYM